MALQKKATDSQLQLDDVEDEAVYEGSDTNSNGDTIGCCNRYRECSNAGACVCAEAEMAKKCQYKANLESGRVFYGKNAETFDMEKYKYLVSYYNNLSDEEKNAFEEILCYICAKKRGVRHILCLYNSVLHSVLSGCELFAMEKPSTLILTLYGRDILMLKSSEMLHKRYSSLPMPDFSDIKPPETIQSNEAKRNYIATHKLKIWVHYFMHTDIELHPEFARRFISFEINDYTVFDEFYHDFYSSMRDTDKYLCVFDSKNLNTFKEALRKE